MNNKNKFLTPYQFIFVLVGLFIGPEFLSLSSDLTKYAHQDAWISAIFGLIYPIYVIIIGNYLIKKFPNMHILDLNKIFFGKFAGTFLNIVFSLQFVYFASIAISEYVRILQMNLVAFLTPVKILVAFFLVALYGASKGLRTMGKVNAFFSVFLIGLIMFSFFAFRDSSLYNILPVFNNDIKSIMEGTFKTVTAYAGFEILFFIHIYAKDSSKIKSSSLIALGICSFIWVWTVIISILFLGPDIVPKTHWPFLFVYGSINFAMINNARYFFLMVWAVIGLEMMANYILISSLMLNNIIKYKFKIICIFVAMVSLIPSFIFIDDSIKHEVTDVVLPVFVVFNLVLITSLALIVSLGKKNLPQKSDSSN